MQADLLEWGAEQGCKRRIGHVLKWQENNADAIAQECRAKMDERNAKQYAAYAADPLFKLKRSIYNDERSKDPKVRLLRAMRARLRIALNGHAKAATTMTLVGCSTAELRAHLEQQWQLGMSWTNYGKWHVDHIRPCASYDLSDPEQQRACFHHGNLQPLWAVDNLRKGDSLPTTLPGSAEGLVPQQTPAQAHYSPESERGRNYRLDPVPQPQMGINAANYL